MSLPPPSRCLRWALLLWLGCASACHAPPGLGPRPHTVSPASGPDDTSTRLTLEGEGLVPEVRTDFARGEGRLESRFQLRLGRTPLTDVVLAEPGRLQATVPAGLAPGRYTLTVVDPAGREGTLPEAFVVFTPVDSSHQVARFVLEPVGPQRAWEPFPLTVHAVDASGERVAGFNGTAALTDATLHAVPSTLGPFRDGTWRGLVEVRQGAPDNVLTVRDEEGRTGTSAPFPVAPRPAVALRFGSPPRASAAGDCSEPLTLRRVDDRGQPVADEDSLEVLLEQDVPGFGALYADAGCATPLEALVLPPGASELTLHVRGVRAGGVRLTARAPGLRPARQALWVGPAAPARLVFLTPPPVLNAGTCAPPALLEVQDAFGNPSPVAQALTLALAAAPAVGFGFHPDAACALASSTPEVAQGESRASVRYRPTVTGTVRVEAHAPGLAPAVQTVTVHPQGEPTRLAFATPARHEVVGECSEALRVRTEDSLGNASAHPGGLWLSLTATPSDGVSFYEDAACTRAVTGLALPAGATEALFHVLGTTAMTVGLTVSAPGLDSATQSHTLEPGAPALLRVDTAPQALVAGLCSQPVGLRLTDALDNTAPAPQALSLSLEAQPSGEVGFYLDSGCTQAVDAVPLEAGQSTALFYFRALRSGELTLTASAPGLRPASQLQRVSPASPKRLGFLTAAQRVAAGTCSQPVTLEVQDAFGNPSPVAADTALALSASPGDTLRFFSDPTCATPLSAPGVPAGGTQATFFFLETTLGTVRLDASASGLGGTSQQQTVVAGVTGAGAPLTTGGVE